MTWFPRLGNVSDSDSGPGDFKELKVSIAYNQVYILKTFDHFSPLCNLERECWLTDC